MGPLDALNHVLNLLVPGCALGAMAAGLAKLLWRRELAGVAWRRLAMWGAAAAVATSIGGLILTGRDGRMVTYGAMVLACAAALAWAGWGSRQRR